MARSLAEVVSQFKYQWTKTISDEQVERACRASKLRWRNRLLTPVTTAQLLLLQILHGNTALTHVRMLGARHFSASAYCQARNRLPVEVFRNLLAQMSRGIKRYCCRDALWHGRRVYIADGSSFSMPDTKELQETFGQPSGQKSGCGFPMAHFVALVHARTGMIMDVLSSALFSSDLKQFIKLHPSLKRSDIVVGDRGFCSYAHLALMTRRGVDVVFRVHQRHIVNFRAGRRHSISVKGVPRSKWDKKLGVRDQIVTWFKPKVLPRWMNSAQYRLLPASLQVREFAYSLQKRGFRTRRVVVVTTLIDPQAFPATMLADLYGQRWAIETNFRNLKTTMGMDALRCKTVHGVLKEFYAFCIVYNLVRTVMLQAAATRGCSPERISFIDALRWLVESRYRRIVLSLVVVPQRQRRHEPRAIKRRPKQYDRLNKPRKDYRLQALAA